MSDVNITEDSIKNKKFKVAEAWIFMHKEMIVHNILALLIFILAIWGIGGVVQPILYDDEFGYLASSAFFTGQNWSSVAASIPYFPYGYGLLLAPFRLIFHSTLYFYSIIIIINGIMLVTSYYIALKISERFFESTNWMIKSVVCFAAIIYPSNIVYAHAALPEVTLVLLFWVFAWILMKAIDKPSNKNHIGLAATVVYAFMLHERTIPLLITSIVVVSLLSLRKRSSRSQIIAFSITFVSGMIVYIILRNVVQKELFLYNDDRILSDIQQEINKIMQIFTAGGFLRFLISIMGEIFYLSLSTGMILFWGITNVFIAFSKKIISLYHFLRKKNRQEETERVTDKDRMWKQSMLFIFLGTLLITAIYTIDVAKVDDILNGRYIEHIIGLFFIFSFISFLEKKQWERRFILILTAFMGLAYFSQLILDSLGLVIYETWNGIGASVFLDNYANQLYSVYRIAIFTVLFAIVFIMIGKMRYFPKREMEKSVLAVCVVAGVWGYMSLVTVDEIVIVPNMNALRNVSVAISEADMQGKEAEIYYLTDTVHSMYAQNFQFFLPDQPVELVTSSEIKYEEGAYYIMSADLIEKPVVKTQCKILSITDKFAIAVKK